jgi:hypothetical protein
MHKLSALLLLAALASGLAQSQDASTRLFLTASHCLATERNWLPVRDSTASAFEAAYIIDTKSDPGVDHIYVVVYTNKEHSKGKAFDLRYKVSAGKTTMDLQNNAGFAISRGHVVFSEPPLGGTWTQTHLASAIMQAGKRVATVLDPSQVSPPSPDVKCESYVSNK